MSIVDPDRALAYKKAQVLAAEDGHDLSHMRAWAGPHWYRARCVYCLLTVDLQYNLVENRWVILWERKPCDWCRDP